jgi:hypothetical protein
MASSAKSRERPLEDELHDVMGAAGVHADREQAERRHVLAFDDGSAKRDANIPGFVHLLIL